MRAPELCDLASDWLAARHPGALIVRELSVAKWGKALIDIAAILPNEIVGVEIKGEGDTPARLKLQGLAYSRVASRMFLLHAPGMDRMSRRHLPDGWYPLSVVDGAIDHGHLGTVRYGQLVQADQLPNAPAQLLECLITREIREVGKALMPGVNIGRTVPPMIAAISENVPLAAIRSAVCAKLRSRDWLGYDRSIMKERADRYRWAPEGKND